MLNRLAFLAPLLLLAAPAAAQNAEIIKGVYLGSKEACDEVKKDSLQTFIEAGNTILTNRGFEAIEFNCAFLQMLKNPRMDAGWVATSMCEQPGYAYPELFSIVERTPGELEIAALSEGQGVYAVPQPDGDAQSNSDQTAQPDPNATPETPAPQADQPPADGDQAATAEEDSPPEETFGLSGTYYRCDGVAAP